jgi:adenosylhomocysteine nucleosidase
VGVAIAIVSAMHEELRALLARVDAPTRHAHAGRTFHVGTLAGEPAVLVLSGIGKVAAAATTAMLLERFGSLDAVLFTGVAGGLAPGVHVGDVVVARELLQHDLDASPLFPRYEVPLTGRSRFATDAAWSDRLAACARTRGLRLHEGLVVSGDRFVATAAESRELAARLPDALAVEMEGAAVAQVCTDAGVSFAVLRTVSDRADDAAHVDFLAFVRDVASDVTHGVVMDVLGDPTRARTSLSRR